MANQPESRERRDPRCFVQVRQRPSVGVETSTRRAWLGLEVEVGHGYGDALFSLTEEQYAALLRPEATSEPLEREFRRGEHDAQQLFDPRRGSVWPEQWHPSRTRMLRPRFPGELWWHVDALGAAVESDLGEISRALAAGTGRVSTDADGHVDSLAFPLVGDGAYPRPAALIGGLDAGSDRERVRAVLGEPVDASDDVFAIEGMRMRVTFVDDRLVSVALERAESRQVPGGALGVLLAALGEPEEGPRFRAAARLSGASRQRWMMSSGADRRLLVFDDGVEMQVQDDRVLSVRIGLGTGTAEPTYRRAAELLPGLEWPTTRAALREALGDPADARDGTDLRHYGDRELLVSYGGGPSGEAPTEITAVLRGITVSHGFNRWRSGEVTTYMDALGREASNPLVAHVRGLPGVQVRMRGGVVASIDLSGEGLVGFLDGIERDPRRNELRFGGPAEYGARDDLWPFSQGWVHARSTWLGKVKRIVVSAAKPAGLAVRPWEFGRDRMDDWRALS